MRSEINRSINSKTLCVSEQRAFRTFYLEIMSQRPNLMNKLQSYVGADTHNFLFVLHVLARRSRVFSILYRNDDAAQGCGHTKPSGGIDREVQLPKHTYRNFSTEIQLETRK